MRPQSQDLDQALKQAKQQGLISHTKANIVGLQPNNSPNEPDEPINQTLSGIVTILIILLILALAIVAFFYFRS